MTRNDLESVLSAIDGTRSGTDSRRRIIRDSYSVNIRKGGTRAAEDEDPLIHIFNFTDDKGFAIMSGDVRVPSLIALTDSGSLYLEKEISDPGMALFLQGMDCLYIDNIAVDNGGITDIELPGGGSTGYAVYGDWKNIVYFQYGKCPVIWGQGEPYNKYCPILNDNTTMTGCVSTSVAQLMAIYKYPSSYKGYTFNWDEMTARPTISYCSKTGQDNIARLMQQLGLKENLDVSYGNETSSAPTKNSIRTLKAFGYANGGKQIDYNTSAVVEELKQGYGVLVSGYCKKIDNYFLGIKVSSTYDVAHQWLLHGLLERRREVKHYAPTGGLESVTYESQWYPLCNWGWGGLCDGYFLSGAFDADNGKKYDSGESSSRSADASGTETDANFQYKITAITGIRK